MIKLKKRGQSAPQLMLSPMIDMIFLLLIFFIVSTMYMSELRTIPVKLPVATETQSQSAAKFSVTVKRDGVYWLQDKLIKENELMEKAKEERKRDENFAVIIRADEGVPYRAVIHLLDSFRKAGISRVGLATDKEGGS